MDDVQERDKVRSDERIFVKEIVGHGIAFVLVLGFFVVVLAALLGYVDISNPAISLAVGSFVGYAAGNLAPVTVYYFGSKPERTVTKEETNKN